MTPPDESTLTAPPAPALPLAAPIQIRTRARRLLVVPALALAAGAEWQAAQARGLHLGAPPALTWQLFAVAAILWLVAAWPVPRLRPVAPTLAAAPAGRPGRRWAAVLLGLSVLAACGATPLFVQINATPIGTVPPEPANTGAWALWIAALLLFAGAAVLWERSMLGAAPAVDAVAAQDDALPGPWRWILPLALFVLALALRLPDLGSLPAGLWFDEAQNGVVAQQLVAPGAAHLTFITGRTELGALYFYILGLLLHVTGPLIWPLRLLPALSGAALAPLVYLLGRHLFGWRAGLAAGGLLAVSAWNITFSRFGMLSLPTVALDVGVYLCAVSALRTGRLGYYAGAGVLLGLAMQMYYPARLVPVVLLAVLLHLAVTERRRLSRAVRAGAPVLVLAAVIAFLPVALFAIQHPADWSGRVDEVSVFNSATTGGDPQAFTSSLNKHLLMFNYRGDQNGRHDLPEAPLLDDLTAALFFLGLGICILRAWRWQYFFAVVWFAAALSGGVLSLPFEAPQAHRTLENSVVTALVAGLVLGELWQWLGRAFSRAAESPAATAAALSAVPVRVRRRTPRQVSPVLLAVSLVGIALGVAAVATQTLPRYFVTQAQAQKVWKDMYVPETEAARLIQENSGQAHVYVSALFLNLPPQAYLAPGATPEQWPGMQAIPFAAATTDVLIILAPPDAADIGRIARVYPHATFATLAAPSDPDPLLYTARIPAADINSLHGVHATFYAPGSTTPRADTLLPDLQYNWGASGVQPGSVRLETTLQVTQPGTYHFTWQAAGPAGPESALVDGYPVGGGADLELGSGLHSVVATDTVQTAAGFTRLLWGPIGTTPVPAAPISLYDPRRIAAHGLTGVYRKGTTSAGVAALKQVDPVISFYFQITPLDRPYNVVWTGRLYAPVAGTYGFATEQLSQSFLSIDGKQIIANTQDSARAAVQLPLSAGWHDLALRYIDAGNYSHVYLYWVPPGQAASIIPSAFLWPEMGRYPAEPPPANRPSLAEAQASYLPPDRTSSLTNPDVGIHAAPPVTPTPPQPTAPPASAQPTLPPAPPSTPVPAATMQPDLVLGSAAAPLPVPRGVAADAAGNLYVLTAGDSAIHRFDATGHETARWSIATAGGEAMAEASALLLQGGHLLVLDGAHADLLSYNLDGTPAGQVHLCDCFFPRAITPAVGRQLLGRRHGQRAGGGGAAGRRGRDDAGRQGQPGGPVHRAGGRLGGARGRPLRGRRRQRARAAPRARRHGARRLADWPVGRARRRPRRGRRVRQRAGDRGVSAPPWCATTRRAARRAAGSIACRAAAPPRRTPSARWAAGASPSPTCRLTRSSSSGRGRERFDPPIRPGGHGRADDLAGRPG